MRTKIKIRFRDKDDYGRVYEQNEVHEFPQSRALELIALGLVERMPEIKKVAYVEPKVEVSVEPEHTEQVAEEPAQVEEPVKVVEPTTRHRGRKATK